MAEFQRKNSPEITKWYQVPDYSKFKEVDTYPSSGSSKNYISSINGWFMWVNKVNKESYDVNAYIGSVHVAHSSIGNDGRHGQCFIFPVAKNDKVTIKYSKTSPVAETNCTMGFLPMKLVDN